MDNKIFTKLILFILLLTGGIIQYNLPVNKLEAKSLPAQLSGDADRVEEKTTGDIVGTYRLGNGTFNVISIPSWKESIYNKYGLKRETVFIFTTFNTLECGDENGFCIGGNGSDAGPFQINQIHDSRLVSCNKRRSWDYENCPHSYSEYLVEKGREAYNNSLKTGNWKTTVAIRNTLFNFQVGWLIPRVIRFDNSFCKGTTGTRRMRCQAVLHNGSSRKNYYGTKSGISFDILRNYYYK